jgi:hypothetical protein
VIGPRISLDRQVAVAGPVSTDCPLEFISRRRAIAMRSPRVASNISDLDNTCALEAFEGYGGWSARQLGMDLDEETVLRVDRDSRTFHRYR